MSTAFKMGSLMTLQHLLLCETQRTLGHCDPFYEHLFKSHWMISCFAFVYGVRSRRFMAIERLKSWNMGNSMLKHMVILQYTWFNDGTMVRSLLET